MVIPKEPPQSHRESRPRTEAASEIEALGEYNVLQGAMSRKDGMRYCYRTATFYLFMPGRRGRSARALKDWVLIQQMAFSSHEGTEPTPRFKAPLAIARLYYRVQGTCGRRDLRLANVNGPANPGYIRQDGKAPRAADACRMLAEPT
jgi:hypothetical protein